MASSARRADVLVIGAGMAGVTAAQSLRQFDEDLEVIVLEGRPDRIGGRIWSSYEWPEAPIDLGASWVSHLTINPLGAVAKENGIELCDSDLFNIHLTQGNGRALTEKETNATMMRFFGVYAEVKCRAEERRESGKRDIDAGREFARALDKLKLPKQKRRNVEFFLNMSVADANGADLDQLSLYEWDDHYVEIMLEAAVVPQGYVKILDAMAEGLDIRLDHAVSRICYDKKGVTVETNHGKFRAAYAVVTLPHPVLASDAVEFSPRLPDWKRKAIRNVGVGLADKFWFLFKKCWWKWDKDFLGRVDEKGEGRWSTWLNFHHYKKDLPLLMCFNRTEHALALEKMTDDEVIDEALEVLRNAYGSSVPRPLRMKRSMWHADPFARGTIPNIPVGSSTSVYNTLGRPVGRLRFAGDSTIREFNGLVFGAFLSGAREAGKLLPLLYGVS
ncbi:MAG TPA: FAD-dependent oxidoreductase [Thermoanaerobaculia bacterium]|nr:FAD-dependent oxidoreductase [Thermoanaerobaculia bacterium]